MTDWTGRKRSSETLCRGGWLLVERVYQQGWELVERVYQEGWASPAAQPHDVLLWSFGMHVVPVSWLFGGVIQVVCRWHHLEVGHDQIRCEESG